MIATSLLSIRSLPAIAGGLVAGIVSAEHRDPAADAACQAADVGCDLRNRATRIIADATRAPSSAEFRNVVASVNAASSSALGVVCGEFNGANEFGGRTGFNRFVMLFPREQNTPPFLVTAFDNAERLALTWHIRCEQISPPSPFKSAP